MEGFGTQRSAGERGQATVEWVALVLLVALLVLGLLAAAGERIPGGGLARAVLDRIVCAAGFEGSCAGATELVAAYGAEVAELVRGHAPELHYEDGMVALPVDFRFCRHPSCSDGDPAGIVDRSASGEPVVAFVHVVDCRRPGGRERSYDCSGERSGNLYLQYWFYYPTSSTAKALPGKAGFHPHDWEGYQLRIEPGGAWSRASSHHGYNYEHSKANVGSDAGIGLLADAAEAAGARPRGGWGPATGRLYVSGGSHAGNAKRDGYVASRTTPAGRIRLIPIEPLASSEAGADFGSVTPPWRKIVYRDPESERT